MVELLAPTVADLVSQLMPWLSFPLSADDPVSAVSTPSHSRPVSPSPAATSLPQSGTGSASAGRDPRSVPLTAFNPFTEDFPPTGTRAFQDALGFTVTYVAARASTYPFLFDHLSFFIALAHSRDLLTTNRPYPSLDINDPSFIPAIYALSSSRLQFYNTSNKRYEESGVFNAHESRIVTKMFLLDTTRMFRLE